MSQSRASVLCGLAIAAVACAPGADSAARTGDARSSYRRAHRAYDGAPPVIPHAVRSLGRQDCITCHREGMDLQGGGVAARTPHPERGNCQQCHVEQTDPRAVYVESGFLGLRYPSAGTRTYPGAPPTLPHPRNGRENCLGCHGTNGGSPIRSPHADRVNCLQCHVEQHPGVAAFAANGLGPAGGQP